jgi:hypothetical protein
MNFIYEAIKIMKFILAAVTPMFNVEGRRVQDIKEEALGEV